MVATSDFLQRFQFDNVAVNGVLVRLQDTWRQVSACAEYPSTVARLLGETLAASALFTGNIKFRGRLSIQIKGGESLPLVFTECTHEGRLRGLARWRADVSANSPISADGATLAITIEQSDGKQRSQGLIAVQDNNLSALFEQYFDRSEQLPTRLLLANDGERCGGIMLQRVAGIGGIPAEFDTDSWNRVEHLLATLTGEELLRLSPEVLLRRLFHAEPVSLFAPRPLHFGCSCSRERVGGMLRALGHAEAIASVWEDGMAEVICEFCNAHYHFDVVDIELLFSAQPHVPTSDTNQ